MVRLVIYLLSVLLIASGLAWLADRPGTLQIAWQGYDIETSVFRAVVLLAAALALTIFLWSLLRAIWNSPSALGNRIVRRRQKRGLEALSSGMIAVGAGDKLLASRYAMQARKALPHEPLTHLLRAQAAQLSGDRATTRRIYEAMLAAPETEQLGLRGLFLEAEREGETGAALQFAERAQKANPKLGWSSDALFELQCKQKNWSDALDTLGHSKRSGSLDKASFDRKRAVLLTAQAQDLEDGEPDKALGLAMEAHGLAPDLVAAAAIAGRIHAARGNTAKAAKVLQKTWARAPHPDLATAYAHARIGDSTRDRLDRIRQLAAISPQSIESPIAVATTAIDARMFTEARNALAPLLADRLTQRVALLMARIEAGDSGDKGKVREWLARAANAARDPVWFADGVISNRWEPVSPVTGRLDAFQWRVPAEALDPTSVDLVANRIEELLALSGPAIDEPITVEAVGETRTPRQSASTIVDAETVTVAPQRSSTAPKDSGAGFETHGGGSTTVRGPISSAHGKTASTTADIKVTAPATAAAAQPSNVAPIETAAKSSAKAESRAAEPKIFVAPHAPDDPGPDDSDSETPQSFAKRPFRAVN
jgi:HemY protein